MRLLWHHLDAPPPSPCSLRQWEGTRPAGGEAERVSVRRLRGGAAAVDGWVCVCVQATPYQAADLNFRF
jgi:hypothetical protein